MTNDESGSSEYLIACFARDDRGCIGSPSGQWKLPLLKNAAGPIKGTEPIKNRRLKKEGGPSSGNTADDFYLAN